MPINRVAIIVPCYNEAQVIASTVKRLYQFCNLEKEWQWTIVIVDDGSQDATWETLTQVVQTYTSSGQIAITPIRLPHNQGKGAAIQAGVRTVRADAYAFFDADISINIEKHLAESLRLLEDSDVVIGKRAAHETAGYSLFRTFGSRLFNLMASAAFRLPFSDIQCGYKVFRSSIVPALLSVTEHRFSFDLELLLRVRKQGLKIQEQAVSWVHRQESSVRLRDAFRYVLDLLSISEVAYTPRTFILLYIASAVLLTALLFGWTVYYGYFFSDDFTWIWHGAKIRAGDIGVLTAHMSTFYSPVLNAFYGFGEKIIGLNPPLYFLFGLIVHAATAACVGLLTKEVSRSYLAGLFAVIMFASVGGAYEPLVWIGANMHSLVAFFLTLSVWGLVCALTRDKFKHCWLFLSLVALILAFGTKEIAVIGPPLLLLFGAVIIWSRRASKLLTPTAWYWFSLLLLSGAYGYKQFMAQKASVWIAEKIWFLDFGALLRLPISLLDIIVPITPIVNADNATPLSAASVIFFAYIVYRFRAVREVWLGLAWLVLSAMPVIFFVTPHWFDVLPSRYTYTMRVGFVLLIASVLYALFQQKNRVRVIQKFFVLLVITFVFHTVNTARIVTKEYAYVYTTGRSLMAVTREISNLQPSRVYVDWYRPFAGNNAHIVGALDVFAGIKETQIRFLDKDEIPDMMSGDVWLRWHDRDLTYEAFVQ